MEDLESITNECRNRAYPSTEISIEQMDNIIGMKCGVSDYTLENVKRKLSQFGFMKPSITFPGMWTIVRKGPQKTPEKELDDLLHNMKGGQPEAA
jgi:hypothetical protein